MISTPPTLTVDSELSGSQSTNHDQTSTNPAKRTTETKLLSDLDQSASCALAGETLGLVNLGKHGIGRLGDNCSGETGNQTRTKVDGSLHAVAGLLLIEEVGVRELGDLLIDNKLGHGVWNPTICES